MIYFDVTNAGRSGHASGLNRVSVRLREELGGAVTPVAWHGRTRRFRLVETKRAVNWTGADWLLTCELFSEEERPGFGDFIQAKPCRLAAIFHDAIPMKFPHITWPKSVARHPGYMSLLAQFDRVLAVSAASADELRGFWRWQGRETPTTVGTLTLGADFNRRPRAVVATPPAVPALLCVGILEPRKNQVFLMEVCDQLWGEGLAFELHLVGRVNPHFGKPVAARVKALRKQGRAVRHHEGIDDAGLLALYGRARATAFPTIAEGCGLPVVESLWMGVPCVCGDLPVLRENAAGGGCVTAPTGDPGAWRDALRRVLADDAAWRALAAEAGSRPLATWADSARQVRAALEL